MSNRAKNILYSLILLVILSGVYFYRQNTTGRHLAIQGRTMGTTYSIKYIDYDKRDFRTNVDSLLYTFNQSLSTYIPDAEISRFNRDTRLTFQLPYFYPVLKKSEEIYQLSKGAFDPTVGPLVNAWGFGPQQRQVPDSATVDSLRRYVGFSQIAFDRNFVSKPDTNIQLDFSAIAKGYGVDVIGEYLERQGITDYMVEIGGEVRCRGRNQQDEPWRIGIDNPQSDQQNAESGSRLQAVVHLEDRSMATSGNYRNYYEQDGQRYSHTINPRTGYPVTHSLLSASVFAPDCMTADALATAFMVMGKDEAIRIVNAISGIDVYLIFSDENNRLQTYYTEGLRGKISE